MGQPCPKKGIIRNATPQFGGLFKRSRSIRFRSTGVRASNMWVHSKGGDSHPDTLQRVHTQQRSTRVTNLVKAGQYTFPWMSFALSGPLHLVCKVSSTEDECPSKRKTRAKRSPASIDVTQIINRRVMKQGTPSQKWVFFPKFRPRCRIRGLLGLETTST